MSDKPAYFDLETIVLLRETLEDAWPLFGRSSEPRRSRPRWPSASSKSAAQGERDRDRLLDAALMEFSAEEA